ncbi:MAG: hypothetical protein JNL08_11045 [Planctomycetes bacterium]|nr:hypothetical protein [Planctomycetota bacterium]
MRTTLLVAALAVGVLLATDAIGQKPAPAAQERTFVLLPRSCYFVIPPRKPAPAGTSNRLLVVLPGGDGSREFLPFVQDGIAAQVPDDCAVALVTAVKWRDDQVVVWPTAASPVPDMAWPTEQLVGAVVDQVAREFAVEPARRAVLAWSSSGPAIWPLLVAADGPFARGYVAMSVWPEPVAPAELAGAKGRRIVIDQSPEDTTTPFHHARAAYDALSAAGAVVRVSIYRGGHGWNDRPLPRLKDCLGWLFGAQAAPAPRWPPPPKAGANLLRNGGFEQGLDGWRTIANSGRLTAEVQKQQRQQGKQALYVRKTGGAPLDLVTQEVELPPGRTLTAAAQLRCKGVQNAWLKVWRYGKDGKPIDDDVDLVRLPADGDWQRVEKQFPCAGAVRAVVQLVVVLDGEVWLDDVSLTVDG